MIDEMTIFAICRKLRRTAWMNRSEIEKVQQKKLRALINHAYLNVPYYHRLFNSSGIKPEDIKTVEDLSKIPITTKTQMKSAGAGVLAKNINPKNCIDQSTSGSTGEPLRIINSKRDYLIKMATYRRAHTENGLHPYRDTILSVTAPKNIPKNKKWYNYFNKSYYISVFEDVRKQISTLEDVNPDVINGYGSAINLLALAAQERGVTRIKPKLIITGSDTMNKESRGNIKSAFGVTPIDTYNSVENGCMAWECSEHMGYHINIDTCVMEFIKDSENIVDEEMCEIVITDLNSYTMPLIRYDMGDIGIPSTERCCCGRGLPLMKMLAGRTSDFMILSNGKMLSPIIWPVIMERIVAINQYKIIQEKIDKIKVQIVKGKSFSQETNDLVKREIKKVLGDDVYVELEFVNKILREKSGKVQTVVSKVFR